jgi:hypothetical protein
MSPSFQLPGIAKDHHWHVTKHDIQRWPTSTCIKTISDVSCSAQLGSLSSQEGITSMQFGPSFAQTELSVESHLNIIPERFVVVRIIPQGKKKVFPVYFVGFVICVEPGRLWRIKCMRRHRYRLNDFVFPEKEDSDLYTSDEVVKVLSEPKILRNNVHHFSDELSPFLSGLR